MHYKADIAGGSLKLYESRIIAGLLLESVSAEQWKQAIEVENVLQKTSQGTAKRQASLIRARLKTMTSSHWILVRDGPKPLATQSVFAAAISHSQLLTDKLGDSVFQILTEVGMLSEGSKPSLQRVHYQPEIMSYLREHKCEEVVRAMQAFL